MSGGLCDRLWSHVDKSGDCWTWLGYKNAKGYGRITVAGRVRFAHRIAYELVVGPIPDGLHIDHLCRNRACVRPDHLEPVTPAENTRRGANSLKTHCPQGHPYSGDNLLALPCGAGNTHRICRECHTEHAKAADKRYKARKRAERLTAVAS